MSASADRPDLDERARGSSRPLKMPTAPSRSAIVAAMPFRSQAGAPPPAPYVPADPLARFEELYAALARSGSWLADKAPLRLASVCLLTTPGDATRLAASMRRCDAALHASLGWLTWLPSPMRLLLAAQILKHSDSPVAFVAEVERVRGLFRAVELRGGVLHEGLAVLVLRRLNAGGRISTDQVARLRDIFVAMKRHHWFLTRAEDLSACAMLVARPEAPVEICESAHQIYCVLRGRTGLRAGDKLQTTANLLCLAGLRPGAISERYVELLATFRATGLVVPAAQYDALALLCLLARPIDRIVATVVRFLEHMRGRSFWVGKDENLSLAMGLAFIQLAGQESALARLADAKLMLDLMGILAARD
jgi:hypothetical protein